MTPLFPARRAAEEFDEALAGTAGPEVADRHADLLRTAEQLRNHAPPQPRPEFVADLRQRLLTAAEDELAPAHRLGGPVERGRDDAGGARDDRRGEPGQALPDALDEDLPHPQLNHSPFADDGSLLTRREWRERRHQGGAS